MEDIKGIRTLILNAGTAEAMRSQVRHYLHQTMALEEKLYETLKTDDAFYLRADPLRHPIIFYLGHTAAFFINKLNIAKYITHRINPALESMFAVGVDEMSWDDLNATHYDWPSVLETKAYRNAVRAYVDSYITNLKIEMPITWSSPLWTIIMGIEHARIHIETSSVLIRQLPLEQVVPLQFWEICQETGSAPVNELIPVAGGKLKLGKAKDNPLFGWDNEYGCYETEVADFKASRYLVSNAEFLPFIEAGGYADPQWWTPEGWSWNSFSQRGMPLFWQDDSAGGYLLRTMASLIPMPWDWPVEVNYLEAKAFTNWLAQQTGKALRLPSEEEWYVLRDKYLHTDLTTWSKAPGNINLEHFASSCPVNKFRQGDFFDLIGNVWQWTETPIFGYPGFSVHPHYDDFSTPTFDSRHNMIKGGSWISTGNEAIRDSRYAFRRHFYQHAGFRYVETEAPVVIHEELYETEADVVVWCDAQWTVHPLWGEAFSPRLVNHITPYLQIAPNKTALAMGCKTGRSAFELTKYYEHVTGVDFTARHINVACDMREKGRIRYVTTEEGEIQSYREVNLKDFGLEQLTHKVDFWQADASNLNPKFTGYDLILLENLLTETYNPIKLLHMIHERLNDRGLLVIADSYHWEAQKLDKACWLGGFRRDGEPHHTLEMLHTALQKNFAPVSDPVDIPLHLKKDNRNYDLALAQITVWRKL